MGEAKRRKAKGNATNNGTKPDISSIDKLIAFGERYIASHIVEDASEFYWFVDSSDREIPSEYSLSDVRSLNIIVWWDCIGRYAGFLIESASSEPFKSLLPGKTESQVLTILVKSLALIGLQRSHKRWEDWEKTD